jgi:chromosome segregation ATPase
MMPRPSLKAWVARKFDARYVKRTELDKVVSSLEAKLAASQADIANLEKALDTSGEDIANLERVLDTSREDIANLEKAARESYSDTREALRTAREGGFAIESLLETELKLQQQVDTITGEGL